MKNGKRLYVIECKAYAQSQQFFRGDPDAVQQQSSRLNFAYKQAETAAEAIKQEITLPDSPLNGQLDVQFCVCAPSQQFVRPFSRFGWLSDAVPKVCTPEELISVLQRGE